MYDYFVDLHDKLCHSMNGTRGILAIGCIIVFLNSTFYGNNLIYFTAGTIIVIMGLYLHTIAALNKLYELSNKKEIIKGRS
jgi:hypothetical protein